MRVFGQTDIGNVRKTNQDAYGITKLSDDIFLAVVCDGMGGANAGNIASACAVKQIENYITHSFRKNTSSDERITILSNAILSANIEIYGESINNPELSGMGTTVVAAIVDKNSAVICHVGDSRAYLCSENIVQVTRDHSVIQNLLESGQITPDEAKTHPDKNVITRALGVEESVVSDSIVVDFPNDTSLLICTDGLSNMLSDDEIKITFQKEDISEVANALTKAAKANGGVDNITAVVVYNG